MAMWLQDNGVGILEEYLAHIFDPFVSTKKGARTDFEVPITYRIVEKPGSDGDGQSTVEVGTLSTVSLPRANAGMKEHPWKRYTS